MKIANLLSPDTETSLDDTRYQGTTDPRNTDVGRRHVGPPSFDPRTGYMVAENSLASPSTGPSNSISFTPINAHRPQRVPEPSSYWPANDLFVGAEKSDDSETPRERAINALRTAQMTFHEGVSKHLGPPSRRAGAKAITKARQNEASFATWQSSAPSAMAAVESLLQFIPQEAPVESDELTEDEKQHLAVWLRHNDEYQAKLSRSWRDGSWASFLPLAWLALRLSYVGPICRWDALPPSHQSHVMKVDGAPANASELKPAPTLLRTRYLPCRQGPRTENSSSESAVRSKRSERTCTYPQHSLARSRLSPRARVRR